MSRPYFWRRPCAPKIWSVCAKLASVELTHVHPNQYDFLYVFVTGRMSKRAYPQNPAVPTWANQPNAGVMGQPHRNMGGYPAPNVSHPPVSGYPGHQFGGQPIQNYPDQPGQNYSGQHYPGQPVKQYAGPSAHISQQRQAVLRPPSSNFPGPPPTIPQTTAGPWTAADVSTATTAVQQMQLDKQSGV